MNKTAFPLPPNSTIGIVGGGQLGRMLASAAARLGFQTIILEPTEGAPAAQVANRQIVAPYDDEAALAELAELCDVVTYEFENVPLSAARFLEERVALYPPAKALEVSQDRLVEKEALERAGIEVAPYRPVDNTAQLEKALAEFGGGVLKTRRFGYDGKGQHVFQSGTVEDADAILSKTGSGSFVLEKLIDFRSEFSVIAARARDGAKAAFDPATNVHEEGILRTSTVPASIGDEITAKAAEVARKLLDSLDYVGVIGIEFFETADGILVNEIAPRVHNSGHWTREACHVSQFEQHIRAISGHMLGVAARHSDCFMHNLIGDQADDIGGLMKEDGVIVTLYGKAESRPGRKMGHFTRLLKR